MGKDIHMFIVNKGKIVRSNIIDWRNSRWFDNLTGKGEYNEYDKLPIAWGWSPATPSILKVRYTRERGYFDFYHFKVKYFVEWFEKYRPNVDAGWVNTYDKWSYENKGVEPEVVYRLDVIGKENFIPQDWHFIEYKRQNDCSEWLYNYIKENNIDENADVTYFFDC